MLAPAQPEIFLDGRVSLWCGDCLDVLDRLPENSVDSCVTDPPYHLTSIVKRFANAKADAEKYATEKSKSAYMSRGFMGKQWDGGDIAFRVELWAEVLRVLKPGAHLVAFGGTRTYHRMACAIEDAGFEIRDQIGWAYGSGFPKSHNQKGEWQGWGTALKPAWEPIVLARKPLVGTVAQNIEAHGTGAINIDGCRVHAEDSAGYEYTKVRWKPGATLEKTGGGWNNETGVLYSGRTKDGRWPANVAHDGSAEVVELFPQSKSQRAVLTSTPGDIYGGGKGLPSHTGLYGYDDEGSAARFFYTAKADADDRLGSKHPTVKPLDLMQWLVRMVTPPGGLVLDPFAGTGTTGEAAFREGMHTVLIEREEEYQSDIRRRMGLVLGGPEERQRVSMQASGKTKSAGPLFEAAP